MQSVDSSFSGLASDIERVRNQFPKANSAVLGELDPLTARINAILQVDRAREPTSQGKAAITRSVGNFTAYRAALEDFAKRFPESEIAGNLRLLNQESQIWEGFPAWHTIRSQLPQRK